jgi:hypothetical protein
MPGYTSTVPAAITGLIAVFKAAPALEGVAIHDGPNVSESKALEAIAVGFTGEHLSRTGAYPEIAQPVAEVTASLDGQLSLMSVREQYPLRCMVAVMNGAKNIAAARTRAYELLSACGAAVAADKKLGGAVALAMLGSHTLSQQQMQRGAVATIVFEVNCDAWTRPAAG